jgi:hypothetical protein
MRHLAASLPVTHSWRAVPHRRCYRAGLAEFAGRDLREGTTDLADYRLYAHYVAGLVGEGLTRLFVAHGDEAPALAEDLRLADDMGLFLQKTNIIRDYLEDLVEGRAFWVSVAGRVRDFPELCPSCARLLALGLLAHSPTSLLLSAAATASSAAARGVVAVRAGPLQPAAQGGGRARRGRGRRRRGR